MKLNDPNVAQPSQPAQDNEPRDNSEFWWEPEPGNNKDSAEAADSKHEYRAGLADFLRAKEIELEATKLRVFGGIARKAGAALIGEGGLTLLTDYDLQSSKPQQWLLKHVIPDTGLGVVYGDSGTFKSFVALDMMAAIATGQERWFGYRVKRAPCIYIPFEGKGGVPKRVEAWRLAMLMRQLPADASAPVFPLNFAVTTGITYVTDPLNLRNQDDRIRIVQALTDKGLTGGLICIDTLAQAGGGIDENSSEDMGMLIQAFQDLQSRLGGVVLVVHHTGKDASRGMRGHSSLRGAVDFAIEFSKPDGAGRYDAQMRLEKVKDEEAGAAIPFSMQRITLDIDDDGDHITSLVVAQPEQNPNMPEMRAPSVAQLNADVDDFVWSWIKRENNERKRPSARSLASQLNEMRKQHRGIVKREHIRDAIERLVATRRVEKAKHNGNQWLRAVDTLPTLPPPWESRPQTPDAGKPSRESAPGAP